MYILSIQKDDIPKTGTLFRAAALRTLIRVAKSGESFAIRKIRESYNVKRETVDPFITAAPASISTLTSSIYVSDKAIPLMEFVRRPRGKAWTGPYQTVYVEIVRGRVVAVRAGFIATMPSGHIGVFAQDNLKPHRWELRQRNNRSYWTELPIREQFAIMTVQRMFTSKRVLPSLEKFINERIGIEYPHQLAYLVANPQVSERLMRGAGESM